MLFAFFCVWHTLWLLVAYSFIYLGRNVNPWSYFAAVFTATIWAFPVVYKFSFGG